MSKDIDNLETVLKRMTVLKSSSQVAVMRSAIRGGLNVVGKQMRADVDPKVKVARKAVKARFRKGKRVIVAKVGFGVGPRNKKSPATPTRPKGRPGVGIGPNNIHWWVAGTKARTTKTGGMPRGRMPAMQPGLARIAYQKGAGKIKAEMIKRGALQLQKETIKLQKVT